MSEDVTPPGSVEVLPPQRALVVSILVTTVLGVLGIVWGLASGSQMILLDGFYAFVGVAVSWLLLRASKLADEGPTRLYPYGREAATPLVIAVQGVALSATLLWALVDAVLTLLDGGSEVSTGVALAYAAVSFLASVVVWLWLRRGSGTSELLAAEATAWMVAVWRGFGMLVGFGIMGLLTGSAWDGAAPYVDPVMVIVTCVVFLPMPIRMVRTTIVELLEGAPPPEVQAPVLAAVAEVRDQFGLAEPRVRMTKAGPKLYVEIDVVVSPDTTVREEDEVRVALWTRLQRLPYQVWLTVELSANPAWGA